MQTITELLTALGDDEDLIAQRLLEGGFKAHLHGLSKCSACPIARYLRANGYPDQQVGCEDTWDPTIDFDEDRGNGSYYTLMPEPVIRFIALFDSGRFPELVLNDDPS